MITINNGTETLYLMKIFNFTISYFNWYRNKNFKLRFYFRSGLINAFNNSNFATLLTNKYEEEFCNNKHLLFVTKHSNLLFREHSVRIRKQVLFVENESNKFYLFVKNDFIYIGCV